LKLKKVLFAGLAAALAVSGIGKAGAWEEVGIFQLMECSKGEHCAIYCFSDLLADECINYHHIGVEYCLDNGIMNGTSETTFSPLESLTRAQLATIFYRFAGSPAVNGSNPFTDLTEDWYKTPVAWAASVGIVNGTSATTFSPDEPITNEQLATIFYRYAKSMGLDTTVMDPLRVYTCDADDPYSDYAYDALVWCEERDVLTLGDYWREEGIVLKNAGKPITRFDTSYCFYRMFTQMGGSYSPVYESEDTETN